VKYDRKRFKHAFLTSGWLGWMSLTGDVEGLRHEVWSHFGELQHVFLATAEDDQPRLRPVTLIRLGGKLFVATGTGDANARSNTIVKNTTIVPIWTNKGETSRFGRKRIVDTTTQQNTGNTK
jgi:hypothetical protein